MRKLPPDIEHFFAVAQQEVDRAMDQLIAPHEQPLANLDDAMAYALGLDPEAPSSGKRLRPLLCLLVAKELCGRTRPALPFAVAIEFMHNFCLVHDDIEDSDEYRRGRPAVWKRYGLAHAVNIGDYLFTKIFAALLTGRDVVPAEKMIRFFALMSATLDHTHRGQAMDINARAGAIGLEQYMKLVTEKTGYYLAAPLVAGAIAADAPAAVEEALNAYGMFLGPLFQIRDDLIDLTEGKGRDGIGSDVREGKRSFMAAHVHEKGTPAQNAELLRILNLPRAETGDELVARATAIFGETGALDEARRVCGELADAAKGALDPLPPGLRDALTVVTEYLVERTS